MAERAIPWNPIPSVANRYMALGVALFVEKTSQQGTPVSVIVTSNSAQHASGQANAWLLVLHNVVAFRRRPVEEWWPYALPLIAPKPARKSGASLDVALWEVVQSSWLAECVPPNYSHPNAVHHFVIADEDDAYEVAAEGWTSDELPDDFQEMYSLIA